MSDTEDVSAEEQGIDLPELDEEGPPPSDQADPVVPPGPRTAADLLAVFDVPVKVSAVLGRSQMEVSDLLKLNEGTIVELDRKVGGPIDVYINDRLVARGEVVIVENRLGVTMTEIIKAD